MFHCEKYNIHILLANDEIEYSTYICTFDELKNFVTTHLKKKKYFQHFINTRCKRIHQI